MPNFNTQAEKDLWEANQNNAFRIDSNGNTVKAYNPDGSSTGGVNSYNALSPWQSQVSLQPQSTQYSAAGSPIAAQNLGFSSSGSYQQNPYLKQMGDALTGQMTQNWQRNVLPSLRSGAIAAGGFGGSRQGVVEANAMNDLGNNIATGLTNLYGSDWTNAQNRNLQEKSINNSYDLGLQNLDANIYQNNFNNALSTYKMALGNNMAGYGVATDVQNTPLNYMNYFTGAYNQIAGQGGSSSQSGSGNPLVGGIGGALAGSAIYKNLGFGS